jgi:colicin import membrane protein
MRESRDDTTFGLAMSLVIHIGPVWMLVLALLWKLSVDASGGTPVSADVVDARALSADVRAALNAPPIPMEATPPPPQPEPEPLPEALQEPPPEEQPLAQEQLPDPDTVDQAEVTPDSDSLETAETAQQARQRQGQVDMTERERQERAEQRGKTQMQLERERQLADIERQNQIKRSQDAQRLSEERLRQIAEYQARRAATQAAASSPNAAAAGPDDNAALGAAYSRALQEAVRSNWIKPDGVSPTQICKIRIRQLPGGEVIDAQVDPSCPYSEEGRRAVESAVLKAQPLPYRGFEPVFARDLVLNFRAEER